MISPRQDPEIAVVAPLPMELAAFRRTLTDVRTVQRQGSRWQIGNLEETPILTAVLGDGRKRAAATVTALCRAFSLRRILMIGVAGGLDPGLEVAQVVVAQRIFQKEQTVPQPDTAWLGTALATGLTAVDIVSEERIAATQADKSRLWQSLGADRPAVVDLESATLARVADEAGVPYLVLRAVSDTATESLPTVIPRSRRPDGSISPLGVALRALLSPTAVPQLMCLQQRVRRCAEALAPAAHQLCREGPGKP